MENTAHRAIAIVGVGAVLPDAPNATAFWKNVKEGRYSITDVSADRWDPNLYYDPDPTVPDKAYSKIGGWVRDFTFEPMKWHLPLPPKVVEAMDEAQRWAIACTREVLEDYGYPKRALNGDRTAVILGNAMAGEKHYLTNLRVAFPEYARELQSSESFASLPEGLRREITNQLHGRITKLIPDITEDSMPGELANCIAGRIANLYNFHGPNYVCDAACASAMAAISSAIEGLVEHDFDSAIVGGIDRNMGASTYVKFCKIGALSATGTRPYADGADGFVMGEGAALFLLKRLADAENDGDRIYAVIRGMGGSSDGRGKGITAPNPVGQRFAIQRAWDNAGISPAEATYIEGHGTSTKVGDLVELQSVVDVLASFNLPKNSIGVGSVKSNIGHLKGAAGAAGLLKATFALRDKVLPPSINCERKNPNIDFASSPLYVNTALRPWDVPAGKTRCAGLSAFGFGGTNFHAVLEEYIPGHLKPNGKQAVAVGAVSGAFGGGPAASASSTASPATSKAPLRGALVLGAASSGDLAARLKDVLKAAEGGRAPAIAPPREADLRAPERIAIDYADATDLVDKAGKALKALQANQPAVWKALRAAGIFRGKGPAPKVAFLYTGQGSQYVNMLRALSSAEPIVAETFAEADRIMTPLLGKPLTGYIYVDQRDATALAQAERDLMQTAITQPAVLATDLALTKLLAAYGIRPDMTMGHSLGEYGALVASEGLPFADALEAVSARGREMTRVSVADNGKMAAVFAPIAEVEKLLGTIDGYVVIANINSEQQAVIGGASKAVEQASQKLLDAGFNVVPLPVSHAFHTSIVAPASEPLRQTLRRLSLQSPRIPIVANVDGQFYPTGPDASAKMLDILGKQIASPVQFVKGLQTLYAAGARVFVEVGPKKALQGFAEDVLGRNGDIVSLFTNHPKLEDATAFNQALCGLYASGLGKGVAEPMVEVERQARVSVPAVQALVAPSVPVATSPATHASNSPLQGLSSGNGDRYNALGHLFEDFIKQASQLYQTGGAGRSHQPVVISGAALGLPGTERVFDDKNIVRLLNGEQFIDVIPSKLRRSMLEKHITRVVKSADGSGSFETITDVADVIKLAGRAGHLDLEKEFGLSADRIAALDHVTCLAIAAGIDALRDAGIPLVLRYKTTSVGTQLPDRWGLPDALRDDTGVIFASAFPGHDAYAQEMDRFYTDRARREQLTQLQDLRSRVVVNGHGGVAQELDRRIAELQAEIEQNPYVFDRRFLFRVLSMGHSQFAEYIGARGPNTQINSACASTTQAVSLAQDWIQSGRCQRVVILSADDITTDNLIGWFGSGFLASGAAATDDDVQNAALPFDRRRHGMLIGMGAASLLVESAEAARERGVRPICEVLSTVTANSAFHGTRLDVNHIGNLMESLIRQAEQNFGIDRRQIAPHTVFISHETYTPARGGSASAEIFALRKVFGDAADQIVIANTKGYTGHAMAAGMEDVLAVKALETGVVPPIPNFKEVDPELGVLNLSRGGAYPIEYALRLGAGFGSQISLTLYRWVKSPTGVRPAPAALGFQQRIADPMVWSTWLKNVAGDTNPQLEVVQHTLRVHDQGAAAKSKPGVARSTASTVPVQQVPIPAPQPLNAPQPSPAVPSAMTPVANVQAATVAQPLDAVRERILALVSEKTGYPKDMLDVDLDLEADLGVDTVKQAEVFATVREAYNIPREDNLKLREFPTLAHVIKFVYDRRPDLKAAAQSSRPEDQASLTAAATAPVLTQQTAMPEDPVRERILELVVEKTGYPKDMLDLDLDLEADLGVDTVKQAELFAGVREIYGIERDENRKLRDYPTLSHVIRFVYEQRPDLEKARAAASTVVAGTSSLVAAAPLPTTQADADPVRERILDLVMQKTGYPKDMLDLDLDLEADLGVDTVKQAELFAGVRELYGIERDENRKLRDYPTLSHVIRFVYEQRPDLAAARTPITGAVAPATTTPVATAVASSTVQAASAAIADSVRERVLDLVVEKTGYPKDMLDLELDLEADLGVDTVKQAEIFAALRDIYNIPRDENRKLRDYPTLAHVIRFVYEQRPDLATAVSVVQPILTGPELSSPAPAQVAPVPAYDAITNAVLDIVAEKTGYPKDMLDLELDLEADLGVDTVKQAEMFAAVRAKYNIPRDENLKLRDFPTLAHVIRFAKERGASGDTAATEAPSTTERAAATTQTAATPVQAIPVAMGFEAAERVPRRVPAPVLRPPLALCKPTGVTLAAGTRVLVMPDQRGVADALCSKLQERGVEVLRFETQPDAKALNDKLKEWSKGGPVDGIYWLPALDDEGSINNMDLAAWRDALRVRVKSLYVTSKALYEQLGSSGKFLVSATALGGHHGYETAGATSPLGGSVVGFTKTFKRERAEATVKAVDFQPDLAADQVADLLIAETLCDPGAVEIGYKNGLRWTIGLEMRSVTDGLPGMDLNHETVFVVTGAAGSIVSAITADLAAASGGVFYLLDLIPEPDSSNEDIRRFLTDKEGLKRDIAARIKSRGKKPTPAMVEKELAALERAHAAQSAIEAVRAAGGTAHYFSVNLTDADAISVIIEQVRQRSGKIDVLLHAAGLERSHFLPDKDQKEFDLVFDVKADGWFNLLKAIGDMPLRATVAFSSIAGRFGNGGQTDYSAANDLLCKITSSFRSARPQTRGLVIDWTAWGGIGMATRGSIPKMMEVAGIDMLPPEAGVPWIRRELTAGGACGEVVVANRLGILLQEFDATGGLDLQALEQAREQLPAPGPMVGTITKLGIYSGLTMDTLLDPTAQPFLNDHRIDGTPVLPGVMGIEGFAEAALCIHPGWHIDVIEEVNFYAPFKFYKDEPRAVTIEATFRPHGEGLVTDCRLIGRRKLPGQTEPQETLHFTAVVRLAKHLPEPVSVAEPPISADTIVDAAQIYRIYFHGPAYQVLDRAWWDGKRIIGEMAVHLPDNHEPADQPTLMAPRLIELCFQTAGIWEMGATSRMGLPMQVKQVSWSREASRAESRLYALVTPNSELGTFDAEVVDTNGNLYVRVAGYRTATLPTGIDAESLKPLQAVVSPETADAAND